MISRCLLCLHLRHILAQRAVSFCLTGKMDFPVRIHSPRPLSAMSNQSPLFDSAKRPFPRKARETFRPIGNFGRILESQRPKGAQKAPYLWAFLILLPTKIERPDWLAWIRTRGWRIQNQTGLLVRSTRILKKSENSPRYPSIDWRSMQNAGELDRKLAPPGIRIEPAMAGNATAF